MNTLLRSFRTAATLSTLALAGTLTGSLAACQSTAPAPASDSFKTGRPLGEFVGSWKINGWVLDQNNEHRSVSGTAKTSREKTYFVRMDLSFSEPGSTATVDGTCLFAQDGDRNVNLTNWFSSSPTMRRFNGQMSADGTSFDFHELNSDRNVRLQFQNKNTFTAEVWSGGQQIESYTFTRV